MLKRLITALMILGVTGCDDSANQSADVFFKGRNISYIVATGAGGGYDSYARMISRYMEKYLESGNVIINNVPGAGHIVGTNTLWRARPDGLTIGTFNVAGLIYNQILEMRTMQFNIEEFEWIGKAAGEPRSLVVSELCSIKSMQDLLASPVPVKFGSAGIGAAAYADTKLLGEAMGMNIEVIPGFDGTEGEMAMMRGEVCAQFGTTSSLQPFVDSGYGSFILTVGGTIEGVPHALEFAQTDRSRKIIALMETLAQLGRPTAAPPGTPPDRVKVLQDAYQKALADPDLLAEADKLGFPIEYTDGDEVKRLIVNALNQEPDVIAILAEVMNVTIGQ